MLVGELREVKQLRVQSYVLACSARDRFVPELVRPQKVGPLLVEQPYVLTGAARDRYVPELVRQARSEQPEDSESRDLPAVSRSADRISKQIGRVVLVDSHQEPTLSEAVVLELALCALVHGVDDVATALEAALPVDSDLVVAAVAVLVENS